MRASVFSIFDAYPEEVIGEDRYEQVITMARYADVSRYNTFWVAEHHFQLAGTLPSPPVFLAALARETSKINLGSLVSILPLHNPVELAEQYALVDRLSGGRLQIGLGSGNTPIDFHGFGVDQQKRTELFDKALPIFLKALQGEPIEAPSSSTGWVKLNVRPIQMPHPPIWIAAAKREAVRHVGSKGYGVALIPYATLSDISELKSLVSEYMSLLPESIEPRVAAVFHVYVGDAQKGLNALEKYLEGRKSARSLLYSSKIDKSPGAGEPRELLRKGLVLIGDPDQVRNWVSLISSAGVTDICGLFDFGCLPTKEIVSSMKNFIEVTDSV